MWLGCGFVGDGVVVCFEFSYLPMGLGWGVWGFLSDEVFDGGFGERLGCFP